MDVVTCELSSGTKANGNEKLDVAFSKLLEKLSQEDVVLLVKDTNGLLAQAAASRGELPVPQTNLDAWRANLPHA